jgi:cathepsin B
VPYSSANGYVPACPNVCSNGAQLLVYRPTTSPYQLGTSDAMMRDMMTYGPISADMLVYSDLYQYTGGVYWHNNYASFVGTLGVKIIGWGVDTRSSTPYWLVQTPWGTSFGESGYVRVLRGYDECYIESSTIATLM